MTRRYRLLNNIGGWLAFAIALVVYTLTVEPTASFWDCGEFISSSYKLEVGHPPGAPLFMVVARFFSLFAGNDVSKVAKMINMISVIASALTILFLFWTISHLARKIIGKGTELSTGQTVIILGSALVGSLVYTFSDTFWFSAVEGEVYATSSLFTAVVFWAILKWENASDQKHANRWLIFIAYLMGLSIGIHLLNLLAIPAIVFVYYFRKFKPSRNGIIIASFVAIILLGGIMYVILPWVVKLGSWFELAFVNGIGLPYNSGITIYLLLLAGGLAWGIWYTIRKGKVILNTILLCVTVIIIGYSSFTLILIRSLADPPMDQNNPETLFSLQYYLNREQYGERPLIRGQYYSAPLIDIKPGKKTYTKMDGRYEVTNRDLEYVFAPEFITIFPRMYSRDPVHVEDYKYWGKIEGTKVSMRTGSGSTQEMTKPTFGENLRFFFRYQLGYMYLRYFMWNFAGRQNDIQGHGDNLKGNWISGIRFIDEARLGKQDNLPEQYNDNPARNTYYLLPLLLGLLGVYYLYRQDKKDFWVILLLFFFTGIAIVLYLNQTPHQPRERDYAYAGSFYAFAIWIGLGVTAIYHFFTKKIKPLPGAIISVSGCLLFVPLIMAFQNWDDHDRSGRYTARDFGANYLNSCAPNAILFTNGDNDTFPLWYAQEVEGIRTDVRVVNLSYLGADWYADQMKRKAYESDPIPFSLEKEQYIQGTRDIVLVENRIKDYYDLKELMDFVASDDPRTRVRSPYGLNEMVDFLPTNKFKLAIDSVDMIRKGVVPEWSADRIVHEMRWQYNDDIIYKNHLLFLDLMAHNDWIRPVYIAITVPREHYMGLENYFQVEGMAYRIVPIEAGEAELSLGRIETQIMYDNMMNRFKWGNANDPDVYLDENNRRMLSNLRNSFGRLGLALIEEGKMDSARVVLDYCMEIVPNERVPFSFWAVSLAEGYYELGDTEKANRIVEQIGEIFGDELTYFFSIQRKYRSRLMDDIQLALHVFQQIVLLTEEYNQTELNTRLNEQFSIFYTGYTQGLTY